VQAAHAQLRLGRNVKAAQNPALQKAATEFFPCNDGKVGVTIKCTDDAGTKFNLTHRFWTNVKVLQLPGSQVAPVQTAALPASSRASNKIPCSSMGSLV